MVSLQEKKQVSLSFNSSIKNSAKIYPSGFKTRVEVKGYFIRNTVSLPLKYFEKLYFFNVPPCLAIGKSCQFIGILNPQKLIWSNQKILKIGRQFVLLFNYFSGPARTVIAFAKIKQVPVHWTRFGTSLHVAVNVRHFNVPLVKDKICKHAFAFNTGENQKKTHDIRGIKKLYKICFFPHPMCKSLLSVT